MSMKKFFLIITALAVTAAAGAQQSISTVRGDDLYLLVDVCNYNETYKLFGQENHMSPCQ